MADDEQAILEKIAQAEAALEKARRRASSADAKAAGQRERLQQAEAAGDRRAAEDAKEPRARAEEEQRKADERVAKLQQELEDLRAALAAATADPADSIKLLEPEQPVALLPVRLETRFVTRTGAPGTDLLVRIYPDDVHSSSHEPELTQDEIDWGKSFASEMKKAAGDRDAEQRAWQKLSGRFGPRRAAWVAALMYPIDETGAPTGQSPSYVMRSRAWTRAPRAEALPDRWVVLGYQGGTRVLTEWADAPVSEPLAVGPDPAATVADPGDEALALDDGMRWMVEFDEAVKRGMALRIQLTAQQAQGFDLLMAVGVRWSDAPAAGADRLGALLQAHRYTDGLALVRHGTATNNTREEHPGVTAPDPYEEGSFELAGGQSRATAGTDGALLGAALGLPDQALGRVAGAGGREQTDAMAMNAALWPATWGYFLDQMMAETFGEAAIAEGRGHFVDLVRGRGPLPPLRVGDQPYGVLPVTSLDRWVPAEGGPIDAQMVTTLLRLRELWRDSLAEVPLAGRGNDPDRDLLDVLSAEPASGSFAARELLGKDYLRNLQSFLGASGIDDWWAEAEAAARATLVKLGLPWDPRVAHAAFAPGGFDIRGPLVDETKPPSEELTLDDDRNYLAIFTDKRLTWSDLRTENYLAPRGTGRDDYRYRTLLYLVARHALLAEYAAAAWRILVADGVVQRGGRLEPELVDVSGQTDTIWRLLAQPAPRTGGRALGEYLDDPNTARTDTLAENLGQVRAALRRLVRLPTASLERLLGETLDLSTHRLDAWVTSYATKRLEWLRARPNQATGMHLGGYGWVERLRPGPTRTPVTPPAGEGGAALYDVPGNAGYVHAPSLAHGAAAAILRSGFLTHRATSTGDALAIDFSSERVRLAIELFDGVRAGVPLGALLGYRFERGLHEGHPGVELDEFIPAFRELEPLVARKLTPGGAPLEAVTASNVVDGMKLLERHRSGGIAWGTGLLPPASGAKHDAVVAELDALGEAVDAMADGALAESVYQLAQGNFTRAGATLDAVNRGDAPPPELEVARSARSGIAVTHRVLMLVGDAGGSAGPGWGSASRKRPRAVAEPRLNAWAEQALGDPRNVRCDAVWVHPETGEDLKGVSPTALTLDSARLCALDVLALSVSLGGAESELERRLARKAYGAGIPTGAPVGAGVRLRFESDPSWTAGETALAEHLELARSLWKLLSEARPLDRRDLEGASSEAPTAADLGELKTRADDAAVALDDAAKDQRLTGANRSQLDAALLVLADLGVPGTVALPWEPVETLKAMASPAAEEAKRRVAEAAAAAAAVPASAPERAKVGAQRERLAALFGGGFRALPLFDLDAASGLSSSFGDSAGLQDGDARAAERWLSRSARVRPGAARLERAAACAQALRTGLATDLSVAQLPYEQSDRWLALPLTAKHPARGGRVSFVAQLPAQLDLAGTLAGLLLDEWVETIPNPSETTAITFHHDAPGAQPPQSILLAVNPDPSAEWSLATLEAILLETLELARLRLVDSDTLADAGQFLPALLFSHNVRGEAVSTDFRRAAAPASF